jgi:hypothetical protein
VNGTWTGVERIRLDAGAVADSVDAVRAFMRATGTTIASWWLSERATPGDVEQRLLAAGLRRIESDYLLDGMILTSAPPRPPGGATARTLADAAEFVAATEAQYEAFGTPAAQRRDAAALTAQYELHRTSDVDVHYGAWVDGELAGYGRAMFSPRGAFMAGGSTLPWARGRGAYRALVRARWDDAVARGTPALAVSAGPMSAPILRRLGFETVCRFRRVEDVLSAS